MTWATALTLAAVVISLLAACISVSVIAQVMGRASVTRDRLDRAAGMHCMSWCDYPQSGAHTNHCHPTSTCPKHHDRTGLSS